MQEPAERDGDVRTLVDGVSSGDPAALRALLERLLPDLDGYVNRHAGAAILQKESRSDLVQSVCREVLEDLAAGGFEWRGEAAFRQWVYLAALQKIRMKGRFFGARRRASEREETLPSGGPAAVQSTPSVAAARAEEQERFRQALAALPEAQRQIVQWAHFDRLTHEQIAQRLDVTQAHSRMLLSRALAKLAKIATRRD